MAHATAADVAALLARELSTEETTMVERRLEQAERLILRRIPDLDEKITAGELDEADVIDVEAEAVLRIVRNPDGYTMESDGSYTYQLSQETASGKLEILPSEWELLGVRARGMFQIVPNVARSTWDGRLA
ncbi:Gp19/Gp15/Gp42 family protein [Mycolicibacterium psychrotolerans]|uniref:Phage protein Gp19/Gp15/Gp42 n=1 Tax=Mycolicibacterium psychrotolerans TaxID=216929 RepID=A0A7I7MAX7_9MYCO|nr:Gp19/Gp15/Gp42 family protein [Mycolicibacterium psychrotolerans]BBX69418.1 hypothetical protein MPSYJ_28790 [Mycolicibacterium psychrotolerans]